MLELPGESWEWDYRHVFEFIYYRVNGHISFVRAMIRVSFAIRHDIGRTTPHRIESIDDYAWRIGRTAFVYVPEIDDTALRECAELQLAAESVLFLAPPNTALALKCALRFTLRPRKPRVKSISEFVERQLATLPVKHPQSRLIRTRLWLSKYNAEVPREFDGNLLIVKLPALKQTRASTS